MSKNVLLPVYNDDFDALLATGILEHYTNSLSAFDNYFVQNDEDKIFAKYFAQQLKVSKVTVIFLNCVPPKELAKKLEEQNTSFIILTNQKELIGSSERIEYVNGSLVRYIAELYINYNLTEIIRMAEDLFLKRKSSKYYNTLKLYDTEQIKNLANPNAFLSFKKDVSLLQKQEWKAVSKIVDNVFYIKFENREIPCINTIFYLNNKIAEKCFPKYKTIFLITLLKDNKVQISVRGKEEDSFIDEIVKAYGTGTSKFGGFTLSYKEFCEKLVKE